MLDRSISKASAAFEDPPCESSAPPPQPGPFAREAFKAWQYGLAVIPCGGEDGKKARVQWKRITGPQRERQLNAWISKPSFQSANLGIITGASGLTVIDCDTPGKRLELEAIFGVTPVVVATPRGGLHLYYRGNGENSGPIEIDGMKIDVKGLGGLVVAPPSTRIMADGPVRAYQFLEGGWEWVETLPRIKAGALPKRFDGSQLSDGDPLTDRVGIGQRNNTLFNSLLHLAKTSRTRDELLREAIAINDGFTEPLQRREVEATVGSVWRYKAEGRLIVSSAPKIHIPASALELLWNTANGADALALLSVLLFNHGARARRGEDFAIAAAAMQRAEVVKGWGIKRYRGATEVLMEAGLILRSYKGGARRGDAHRYVFGPGLMD